MRSRDIAIGAACFAALGCGDFSATAKEFTAKAGSPAAMCGKASPLDQFLVDWFCAALKTSGEPHMPSAGKGNDNATYRVMLLPSFEPTVIVSIEDGRNGHGTMTVSIVDAQNPDAPMKLRLHRAFDLENSELATFRSVIKTAGFWSLPISADRVDVLTKGGRLDCLDGTMLVLEAEEQARYHLSVAHCAPLKGATDIAAATFHLASTRVTELEKFHELTKQ